MGGGVSAILPLPQTSNSLPPEHKDGVVFFFLFPRRGRPGAKPGRDVASRSAWPPRHGVLAPATPLVTHPRHRGATVVGGRGALSILCGDGFGVVPGSRHGPRGRRPPSPAPAATKKMLLEVHGAGKAGAWVRQQPELA